MQGMWNNRYQKSPFAVYLTAFFSLVLLICTSLLRMFVQQRGLIFFFLS